MIVSSVKAVGRVAGKVVDAEDRQVLGALIMYVVAGSTICLSVSAILGASVVIFRAITGW